MKNPLMSCIALLALGACASLPEPRLASGPHDEGYRERAIGSNRYLIGYRMEGRNAGRAYDLALWRAAQLALTHGYRSFEVVSRETDTETRSAPVSAVATHHDMVYSQSCGLLSCRTYATPVYRQGVIAGAGGMRTARTASLEIVLTNEPAGSGPAVYDAASVAATLGTR
jgi:hypothetical protein